MNVNRLGFYQQVMEIGQVTVRMWPARGGKVHNPPKPS